MYCKNYQVRYSEVDVTGKATISAIISYFQDTTMFHSDSVGQGIGDLMQRQLAWLLISWHIQIYRYPEYAEELTARTWATKFVHSYGYRDFDLLDQGGNVVAKASSIWILYDAASGKMQRVSPQIAATYSPEDRPVFSDEEPWKIRFSKEYSICYDVKIARSFLDTNNHVNNVRYLDFILDAIPDSRRIHSLRINYKKQAVYGDIVHVCQCADDPAIFILKTDTDVCAVIAVDKD